MEAAFVWFVAFNLGWILRGLWEKQKDKQQEPGLSRLSLQRRMTLPNHSPID